MKSGPEESTNPVLRGPIAWMVHNRVAPNLLMLVLLIGGFYMANQIKKEVERVYHIPVLGILPFNEALAALGSRGLFSFEQPKHPWSEGVIQIAEKVCK